MNPKKKQLHINGITGNELRNPMDTNVTREQIYNIHKELAPFGYELSVEDITDGYPLGMQARGRKNIPIVITYKDATTRDKVKTASMKAGLWNRRIKNKKEEEETGVTGWMKKLAKKLSIVIRSLMQNLEEKKPEKLNSYFAAAYDTLNKIDMNTGEIKEAIRSTK